MDQKQHEALNAIYNQRMKEVNNGYATGPTGPSGPPGPPGPAGQILGVKGHKADLMWIDDMIREEPPSLKRLFTCIEALHEELDDLQARHWGKYSPKRALLWWKRLGFTRQADAIMVVPLVGIMGWIGLELTQAAWQQHWMFGLGSAYGMVGFAYVIWRITKS